jgi:hypothetical protein
MNPLPEFPPEVHRFVEKVFSDANRRLSEKIARVPNCPEPSLDLTFVEHLSQYAAARIVTPGWAVRIDVHYLGGLRHFYSWEIADIGVLLFAKKSGHLISQKVALLQSKRLYPKRHGIIEETRADYNIGIGRLLPGSSHELSITHPYAFDFTQTSTYGALKVKDEQFDAIEAYENQYKIPVYYLLYNPWNIESYFHLPITAPIKLSTSSNGGARIIPATKIRETLAGKSEGYMPKFNDVAISISSKVFDAHGWRLERFVSKLFMKCKEGYLFEDLREDNIFALFNRRSGPISAALSITVEQF